MEKEKKKTIDSKKLSKIAVILLIAVIVILGGTFAWLRIGLNGTNTNKVKAGLLDLIVDESPTSTDVVRLERAVPQSYRQGLTNAPYRFTLVNNSTIDTDYTITLEDLYEGADASLTEDDKIADYLIRYILVKNDDELVASNSRLLSEGRTIDTGTIVGKSGNVPTAIPYTLYIWIDSMAGDDGTEDDIMNKVFNARLGITAVQHHQPRQLGYEKNTWIENNSVCIRTPSGNSCFSPSGEFNDIAGEIGLAFGEENCHYNQLGSQGMQYMCSRYSEEIENDEDTCYVNYTPEQTIVFCATGPYNYNDMSGYKSCSLNSNGSPRYQDGKNCVFEDYETYEEHHID